MEPMSRRGSVRVAGALAVALIACAAFCTCRRQSGRCATVAEISGNHGHEVVVPTSVLQNGDTATIGVEGGTHRHVVVLRQADISSLEARQPVRTRTSSVHGHAHEVELRCIR
jgi:hypothetical protein